MRTCPSIINNWNVYQKECEIHSSDRTSIRDSFINRISELSEKAI